MAKSGLSLSGSRIFGAADFVFSTAKNLLPRKPGVVRYLVESADWAVKREAITLQKYLPNIYITSSPLGINNQLLHFGTASLYDPNAASKNRCILTYYHIAPQDKFQYEVGNASKLLKLVHTSCSISVNKLIKLGVPQEKIVKINIPVDLDIFQAQPSSQRQNRKQLLGIPEGLLVIGSFQKDGKYWGEGLEPKLEKGPDIFCEVVGKLSRTLPVFVLLTGPARGYVKHRLEKMHIPYRHIISDTYHQMTNYYNLLDLYLVTSRQEGGPKAVLESMACGVPVVSTLVGQAPEVIHSGVNGFLAEIDDVTTLVKLSSRLLNSSALQKRVICKGLETAKQFSAEKIAEAFKAKIYEPLS